jgi:hypothetical protein
MYFTRKVCPTSRTPPKRALLASPGALGAWASAAAPLREIHFDLASTAHVTHCNRRCHRRPKVSWSLQQHTSEPWPINLALRTQSPTWRLMMRAPSIAHRLSWIPPLRLPRPTRTALPTKSTPLRHTERSLAMIISQTRSSQNGVPRNAATSYTQ